MPTKDPKKIQEKNRKYYQNKKLKLKEQKQEPEQEPEQKQEPEQEPEPEPEQEDEDEEIIMRGKPKKNKRRVVIYDDEEEEPLIQTVKAKQKPSIQTYQPISPQYNIKFV